MNTVFFSFFGFSYLLFIRVNSETFWLIQGLNQGPKIKVPIVGRASLNLAEFASRVEEKDFDLKIPLISGGAAEPSLHVCAICYFMLHMFIGLSI